MAARGDNDGLRVDVIDVGQGDSILIEGPTGKTMIVDSGDYRDQGEQVLDHLDERGIDSIDHLVATHDDADHIGGHTALVEEFGSDGIETVYGPSKEGVKTKESQTKLQYEEALTENGLDVTELEEGDSINFEGAAIDVHNPSSEINSEKQNQNSLVIQVTYGEQSVLLTGDVEKDAETQLVETHADQLSDVDVLKVSHHGSEKATKSESLDRTDPETLIVSSSLNNHYTTDKNENDAHPHDAMLKHVHDQTEDIDLYWTPVHGTTSTIIDNDEMQIETARGEEALSAADVVTLKYYGRINDLDNEQLAEIERIDPADLPEETPEWVEEATLVTDQSLDEAETVAQSPEPDGQEPPIEQLHGETQKLQKLNEKNEKLSAELQDRDETIEELNEKNEALTDEKRDLIDEIQELTDDKIELIDENQALTEESLDLKKEFLHLKAKNQQLETEYASEADVDAPPERAGNGSGKGAASAVENGGGGADAGKSATSPTGGDPPIEAMPDSERAGASETNDETESVSKAQRWVRNPNAEKPDPIPEQYEQLVGKPLPETVHNGDHNENAGIDREDERDGKDETGTDRDRDDDFIPGGLG